VPQLVELLQALNPGAQVLPCCNSQVELGQVLGTGLFSFEEASQAAGWVQAMNGKPPRHTSRWGSGAGAEAHRAPRRGGGLALQRAVAAGLRSAWQGGAAGQRATGRSAHRCALLGAADTPPCGARRFGISNFVYRQRRPFHPGRLHSLLQEHFVVQQPDWSRAMAEEGQGQGQGQGQPGEPAAAAPAPAAAAAAAGAASEPSLAARGAAVQAKR
jgi:G3E family GTPase